MCDPNPCINGVCSVTISGYECECYEGYRWNGQNCMASENAMSMKTKSLSISRKIMYLIEG